LVLRPSVTSLRRLPTVAASADRHAGRSRLEGWSSSAAPPPV